jgi:magnesium transporter
LVHGILDGLVDQLLPVVQRMDEELAALEERALTSAAQSVVVKLSQMSRFTLRLRWLVVPQRDIINRISRGDYSHLIRQELQPYFGDIYDHLVRLDTMIETLRDRCGAVVSIHLATQNNRLNEVMKALGIVGVIFLPLTLISGIFGTNFSNTYMDSQWAGFWLMCGSFAVIAVAMLIIFKIRRWF